MKTRQLTFAVAAFAAVVPCTSFGQGSTLAQMQKDIADLKAQMSSMSATMKNQQTQITNLYNRVVVDEVMLDQDDLIVSDLKQWKSQAMATMTDLVNRTKYMTTFGNKTYFTGTNVYVVNGANGSINGLGNLIVGYNNFRVGESNTRTGSHNLIFGDQANYTGEHSLMGGMHNDINNNYGAILSGHQNQIFGTYNVIDSGMENKAYSIHSVIMTGWRNNVGSSDPYYSGANCNFVLSGYGNDASYDWYTGILSGANNVCYYKGSVFGTGVNGGVNKEWVLKSN